MAARIIQAFPAHAAAPSAPFGVHQVLARLGAMMEARRTRKQLAEMDARLLADIGTSRGQAAMESARPFWDV